MQESSPREHERPPLRRGALVYSAIFLVVAGGWYALHWNLMASLVHLDSTGYYKSAINLLRYGVFSESAAPNLVPVSNRTPGYPWLLAQLWRLTGVSLPAAALLNAVLLWGTGLWTLLGARKLGASPRWQLVAALAVAIHPMALHYAVQMYTDTLFVFLLLAGVVARMHIRCGRGALLLGLALGLATLVRPVGLYLIPVAGALLLWDAWNASHRVRAFGAATLAVMVALTPPALWSARNAAVFGDAFFTEVGAWNLRMAHANVVLAEAGEGTYGALWAESFKTHYEQVYRPRRSPAEAGAQWQREAVDIFRRHPFTTVRVTAGNLLGLFGPSTGDWLKPLWTDPLHPVSNPYPGTLIFFAEGRFGAPIRLLGSLSKREAAALALAQLELMFTLAVIGAALWRVRRWRELHAQPAMLLPLAFALALTVLSLPAGEMTQPRFRMPLWPLLAVLAAAALSEAARASDTKEDPST